MIKIVLHCLPNEIDQVSWIIDQLRRSSKFVDPSKFILDFTLNISAEDINWKKSILTKEYCIDKFNSFFQKSPFNNQHKISEVQTGCNTVRRNAIRTKDNTDHIIYLDTDLFFPDTILYYIEQAINEVKSKYYIITPQIFQLWDSSWDIISHPDYRNNPRENKQWLQNPYQVFEHEIIVKEDRVYRSYNMEKFIYRNNNQDMMRDNSSINYQKELINFKNRV